MSRYKNGQVPDGALVLLASGRNGDGDWEHLLPPATVRKHLALVRLGQERRGRTIAISAGWNGYRPLAAQHTARKNACARGRCGDAAWPGSSSHGGEFDGADAMAIDYGNWLWVWGSQKAFYAACREVGLEPGVFSWEQWHVIDRDPWAAVPAGEEINMEGFLMALTEDEQNEILAAARGLLSSQNQATMFQNGQSVRDRVDGFLSSANQVVLFQNVQATRDRIEVLYEKFAPGIPVPAIDERALAVELSSMLAPLLLETIDTISDESVAAVARAAADEQDRRARERLASKATT